MRFGLISRYRELTALFERNGVPAKDAFKEVLKFLGWSENQHQPAHKIFAYLFAALGWRISSGQRPGMKASILNDFSAISTYAPYVDAMFVDKAVRFPVEAGASPHRTQLQGSHLFAERSTRVFGLPEKPGNSATDDVRELAHELYGAEA